MFLLTTNTKPELESLVLSTGDLSLSCKARAMEPGQQQEIKMGGDHDQNGTSSANTNPLSSVSQGGEGGSDSLKGNEERLTNRAALRKGKWTVSL